MVALISTQRSELLAYSLDGFARALDELPEGRRAQLQPVVAQLVDDVQAFLSGPHDGPAIEPLALSLRRATDEYYRSAGWTARRISARAETEECARADLERLRPLLEPSTVDSAEWALRTWVAASRLSANIDLGRLVLGRAALLFGETAPASVYHLQAWLMAALEALRRGEAIEVVSELVDNAGDAAQMLVDGLAWAGIQLDPFDGETQAQRAERTKRYASHLRNRLTDDDLRILDESRLHSLR